MENIFHQQGSNSHLEGLRHCCWVSKPSSFSPPLCHGLAAWVLNRELHFLAFAHLEILTYTGSVCLCLCLRLCLSFARAHSRALSLSRSRLRALSFSLSLPHISLFSHPLSQPSKHSALPWGPADCPPTTQRPTACLRRAPYTRTHARTHTHTLTHTHHTYIHTYTHTYVCIYIIISSMYMYICIYMYT